MRKATGMAALVLLLSVAATGHADDNNAKLPQAPVPNYPMLRFSDAFHAGDRVGFLGDTVTQQMFYPRAVAAAVLALRPGENIRFFNGGTDDSTAAAALKWVDGFMNAAKPTVIFACFGLADSATPGNTDAVVQAYTAALGKLVDMIRKRPTVRLIVLITPPALQTDLDAQGHPLGRNVVLAKLAAATRQVAREKKTAYVDIFDYMRFVYSLANVNPGTPLTFDGVIPTEVGNTVIASVILRDMGVSAAMLEKIGWSPLLPYQMARVRGVLAVPARKPPTEDQAARSRAVYEAIEPFDEAFFRAWRLGGQMPSEPSQAKLLVVADQRWAQVQAQVSKSYGNTGGGTAGAGR